MSVDDVEAFLDRYQYSVIGWFLFFSSMTLHSVFMQTTLLFVIVYKQLQQVPSDVARSH